MTDRSRPNNIRVGAEDSVDRRRLGRAVWLLALISLVAACGVPTGDSTFEQVATEDISPALAAEATTTTSAPPTTIDVSVTTLPATTVGPESFDTVEVYFLSRNLLRPVELTVAAPVSSIDLIQLLEDGPPESAAGLDSAIPEGLVNNLDLSGGVVTIDLAESEFETIATRDQQSAIAQMVFTFVLNLQGVGQALFTVDGSQIAVPRGDNRLTFQPVSIDDYTNLLADQPIAPPPTTTTTTTTTTVPVESTTVPAASTTAPVESLDSGESTVTPDE